MDEDKGEDRAELATILDLLFRDGGLEEPTEGDEPVYAISVVAELVGVHAQTLRHYERIGLIVPARSSGNVRRYSGRDVRRLRAIVRLRSEHGLSLTGVEALMDLRRRIEDLEAEVEDLRREMRLFRGFLLEDRGGR